MGSVKKFMADAHRGNMNIHPAWPSMLIAKTIDLLSTLDPSGLVKIHNLKKVLSAEPVVCDCCENTIKPFRLSRFPKTCICNECHGEMEAETQRLRMPSFVPSSKYGATTVA